MADTATINPITPGIEREQQPPQSKTKDGKENNKEPASPSINSKDKENCEGGVCRVPIKGGSDKAKGDSQSLDLLTNSMPGTQNRDKESQAKQVDKTKDQAGDARDNTGIKSLIEKSAINSIIATTVAAITGNPSAANAISAESAKETAIEAHIKAGAQEIDAMDPSETLDLFAKFNEEGLKGSPPPMEKPEVKISDVSKDFLTNPDGSLNTNDPRVRAVLRAGGLKDGQIDNIKTVFELSREGDKATVKFYSDNGNGDIRGGTVDFDFKGDKSLGGAIYGKLNDKETAKLKAIQAAKIKTVEKAGGKENYLKQQKLAAKADIVQDLLKDSGADTTEIDKITQEISTIGKSDLKKEEVVSKLKELDSQLAKALSSENGKLASLSSYQRYLAANDLLSEKRDSALDQSGEKLEDALSDGKIDKGEEELGSDLNKLLDKLLTDTVNERNQLNAADSKKFTEAQSQFDSSFNKIKGIDTSKIKDANLKKRIQNMQSLQKSFEKHYKAANKQADKQFLAEMQHLNYLMKNLAKAQGFNQAIEEAKKPTPNPNNNALTKEIKEPKYSLDFKGSGKDAVNDFAKQLEEFAKTAEGQKHSAQIANFRVSFNTYKKLDPNKAADKAKIDRIESDFGKFSRDIKASELEKAMLDRTKQETKVPANDQKLKKIYEDLKKDTNAIKNNQQLKDYEKFAKYESLRKSINSKLKAHKPPQENPPDQNQNNNNKADFSKVRASNLTFVSSNDKNVTVFDAKNAGADAAKAIKAEAKKSGKKTQYIFSAKDCGPCKNKENEANKGKLPGQSSGENVVIIKIPSYRDPNAFKTEFLKEFGINGKIQSFPHTVKL